MHAAFIQSVRILLAALLMSLAAAAAPYAEEPDPQPGPDNVITVIAAGRIQGNNYAAAKQEAVDAALAAAVDQGALIVFSPEALAREFKPYSAVVAGNTEKFIDSYKILGESSSGKYYRVMVAATVSLDQLKAGLTEFQPGADGGGETVVLNPGQVSAVDRPKLLFLLSEQNINDISPRFWWGENAVASPATAENAIAAKAKAAGFMVLEHGNTPPNVPVQAAIIFQPELDNREAADIGRSLGADVVIVGKAIAYAIGDTGKGGDPAYNATITVRAVRTDTGQEITSGFETAVRQDPNETNGSREALTAAGVQAANHLLASIGTSWENIVHPTEDITLTVAGTGNLGNFVRFRQELRDIPGVKTIQVQQMNPDEAVIAVRFEGNSQELGERLSQNPFQFFTIEIRNLSNKGLDIALIPK